MNVLRTLRAHWKKSVFATCVAAYAVNYGKGKYEEWILMKEYCLEARRHGREALKQTSPPRKVAVLLNPACNRGGGRELFKQKVAPLLHLAALDVNILLTKHEGHGKKLAGELQETSAVLVAGGDGTLSEVVTGMLKRADEHVFSQTPLCIVPLGRTNTLAHLLNSSLLKNTQFIAESVMSLVRASALKYVDVFSVQAEQDRMVYGVAGFSIGIFTDSNIKRNTWFYRLLDGRVGYFLTSLFGWQDLLDSSCSFSDTCGACRTCVPPPVLPLQKPWWSRLLTSSKQQAPAASAQHQRDFSRVFNRECGLPQHLKQASSQIDLIANVQMNSLMARFIDSQLSQREYLSLGPQRRSSELPQKVQQYSVSKFKLENLDERRLQIDTETYDGCKSLSIKLLPNKLKFFYTPNCPQPI